MSTEGLASRQEIVSMIPTLAFHEIKETDYILDMCAAPGSKAMQILEKLEVWPRTVASNGNRSYEEIRQLRRDCSLLTMLPKSVCTN